MEKKHLPVPYRLGALFGGLSAACGILLFALPEASLKLAGYMTHGTMQFTLKPFDLPALAVGTVLWALVGWAVGLAWVKLSEI